jgi:hypothetical protein
MLCAPAVVGVELNEYFDTYIPLAIKGERLPPAPCGGWARGCPLDVPILDP